MTRIATFNIRNGDADDGPNSWPDRQEATLEAIRRLDASIIGLQEVMKYQLDFIMAGMPEYAYIGTGRIDGKEVGEFAPILYRRGEFEPEGLGWFWLSETPEIPGSMSWDTACERICTWANFGGWSVFNTHLDHVSEEARWRGVELILSRASERAIVMGDFNATPNGLPVQTMLQSGFTEVGAAPTFHDWGRCEGQRIDYIFARGIEISNGETHSDLVRGRMASDHYAVSVRAEL